MRRKDFAGVVLAGGRAERMGGSDKCLLTLGGRPILSHILDRFSPQVGTVVLNANGPAERFSTFGLSVITDPVADIGPLGGVLAGLSWAREKRMAAIVTVAGDTPFLPADLVARLNEGRGGAETIVQAASGGRVHPTFALWPTALADDLRLFLEENGASSVRAFAGGRHEATIVDFPRAAGRDPFFNINTPRDLETAEAMVREVQ